MNLRKLILLCFLGLLSCEKDDICLEGTPGTPRMIVLFKDYNDPSKPKVVNDLTIKGLSREKNYQIFTGDSIALPLRNNFDITQYKLVLDTDTEKQTSDSLQINHKQFDIYINRACGYISNYIFRNPPFYLLSQGNGWIKSIEIIKDTITDETSSDLAFYHLTIVPADHG